MDNQVIIIFFIKYTYLQDYFRLLHKKYMKLLINPVIIIFFYYIII